MGGLDGPGLRCVVFLQGCPMRCQYCQNPDTWQGSGGTEMTCAQVFAKIERCRPYFGKCGGVTLSGGEPFMQAPFAAELLRACRERSIHTAVDTCGYFLNDDVNRALDSTDLVILDKNPLKVDPLTIKDIKVVETIKDGKTIYMAK